MARSNLAAPDSIGAPYSNQTVKANAFSTFKGPVGLDLPNAQPDNALSQLGSALSRFNPTLNTLAAQNIEYIDKVQSAEARAQWEKTREDYAEASAAGRIPPGANRAYIESYKATELNSKQMLFGNGAHKVYEESGAKNSDDPNLVQKVLGDYTKTFREGALMREGKDRYTPLELANSKFDEGIQGQVNSLMAQHIQYRVNARTEEGKMIAQTNAGLKIDQFFEAARPESYAFTAGEVAKTFGDKFTGVEAFLGHFETNKLKVDLIATKMMELKDPTVAKIADYLEQGPGSKLSGWSYAKNKFIEAENAIMSVHIRDTNFNYQEAQRKADEDNGITPIAKAQMQAEQWKAFRDGRDHENEERRKKGDMDHMKAQSNDSVSNILFGLTKQNMESPHVTKSFDWLRSNDTGAYTHMMTYVASAKKEKATYIDSAASDLATATVRYAMSVDPMGFQPADILAKANNGTINPKSVGPLMDDWDKARLHFDNPFLQNEPFKQLVGDLRKVALNTEADQFKRSLDANKVETQLRRNAYHWLATNPKGNFKDFMKDMTEQAQPLALEASPEFAKKEEKKLAKKTNPAPVPQKDTRSTMEKVLPNAMGGKSKPGAVAAAAGPAPMTNQAGFDGMSKSSQALIKKMLLDPKTDEMDLEAAIHNSGLWPFMKASGRSSAEFKALKDELIKIRKTK